MYILLLSVLYIFYVKRIHCSLLNVFLMTYIVYQKLYYHEQYKGIIILFNFCVSCYDLLYDPPPRIPSSHLLSLSVCISLLSSQVMQMSVCLYLSGFPYPPTLIVVHIKSNQSFCYAAIKVYSYSEKTFQQLFYTHIIVYDFIN